MGRKSKKKSIYIYMYLEEGMATLSSIFSWRIPWTKEHGRLQSMGSQRVGHNWVCTHPSLIHLLYSRNYHNIVKQLHSSTIFFFFEWEKKQGCYGAELERARMSAMPAQATVTPVRGGKAGPSRLRNPSVLLPVFRVPELSDLCLPG